MTTDWASLQHHRGDAADIPKIVADMLGGPDTPQGRDDRFNHHLTLQDRLYREGQWVEAAPAAVELLFANLTDEAQQRYRIPWHISLLTTGGTEFALKRGLPLARGGKPHQKETLEATLDHEEQLWSWLDDEDSRVAGVSARLLGLLPEGTPERVSRLEAYVDQNSETVAAANGCLSLGMLARHQDLPLNEGLLEKVMRDGEPSRTRPGGALGWLWSRRPQSDIVLDALVSMGGEHRFHPALDWLLLDVAECLPAEQPFKEELAVDWLARWNEWPFRPEIAPTQTLFAMIGSWPEESWEEREFERKRPRDTVEEFEETEGRLLRLSGHWNCLGADVLFDAPGTWRSRHRWLGEGSPTLLEAPCPWEDTSEPVWKRWWVHYEAGELDDLGIPEAWKDASSLERLELICEAKVDSYNLLDAVGDVVGDDVYELALECAEQTEPFQRWAIDFLKEITSLPDTGPVAHQFEIADYAIPLMQVLAEDEELGLPEQFDRFLQYDNTADLELIRMLPLERRRNLLPPKELWKVHEISRLLPDYPFHDFAAVLLDDIASARAKGGGAARSGNKDLKIVESVARDHPEVAEALAEARARPDWVPED